MDQATRTLLASLVRRTAPVLGAQIGLTLLLCVSLRNVDLDLGNRGFQPQGDMRTLIETGSEEFLMGLLLVGANAFVAGGTVLLLHSDAKRLKVGLPMRVFLLPMPYSRMVLAHMVFGIAAVATAVAVASAGAQLALDAPIAWWQPVCYCAAAFAALQAWAFTLAERNRVAAAAGIVTPILVGAYAIRSESIGMAVATAGPAPLFLATSVWIAACLGAALLFGRDLRYTGFDVRGGSRERLRPRAPFRSAMRAQLWYEWRRIGWILPCAATAALAAFFVGLPIVVAMFTGSDVTGYTSWVGYAQFFAIPWGSSIHMIVTALQTTAVGASVLAGAYGVLISGEWRCPSTFLPTRPMSTGRLGLARVLVMTFSAVLTLILLMLLTLVTGAIMGLENTVYDLMPYLQLGYEHVQWQLVLAFFWATILMALWIGLWMVDCSVVLALYAVLAAPFIAIGWISGSGLDIPRVPIWIGTVACLAGTAAIIWRAFRLKLVNRGHLAAASVLYLTYTSIFIYYGIDFRPAAIQGVIVAQDWAFPFPHPIDWALWLGLSILPIVPIFSYPVMMARWRTIE